MKSQKTQIFNQLTSFLIALKGKVPEEKLAQFRNDGDEIALIAIEELRTAEELQQRDADAQAQVAAIKEISLKTRETTYKNEIIRLKKYVMLTSRKSKVDPQAVLAGTRDIATKKRADEVIELFISERVDPNVFDPSLPRIRKDGVPGLLLLPGSGVSVYDWEKHLFLVPLISPKTIEESIANAFVEFHWDMDEDRAMRESFGELKVNKNLSITNLKSKLGKDYVTWATKEAKDWKVLDKEVRAWFQTRIAKIKMKKEGEG